MIAPGTAHSLCHWNLPSILNLSITTPASWVPRNKPRPLCAVITNACTEAPVPAGATVLPKT